MKIKIIRPSVKVELTQAKADAMLKAIEKAGRTCYKSETKITKDSAEEFVRKIMKRGHLSVIEHEKITARVICDRGVTHEIVRHRIGSYSQESTRYVNYNKKGIQFIDPCFWNEDAEEDCVDSEGRLYGNKYDLWVLAIEKAATFYHDLIENGATPQEARSVLPNSLKTEIVITYNLREWLHFFKLRCAPAAHPQMREVANALKYIMKNLLPVIFEE